jgi:hypothetical protein
VVVAAVALLVGAALSAIVMGASRSDDVGVRPSAPTAAPVAAAPSTRAAVGSTGAVAFGERFTWPSGIAVELSQPADYTPTSAAAGLSRERAATVEVTVVNGSGRSYAFNSMGMGPKATHGERAASQIFDTGPLQNSVGMSTLLPGRTLTYQVAFSIGAEPAELQMELHETPLGPPAIFIGRF